MYIEYTTLDWWRHETSYNKIFGKISFLTNEISFGKILEIGTHVYFLLLFHFEQNNETITTTLYSSVAMFH